MKVLVTGAGGMVGRVVSQYCLAQGDSVSALDHKTLDISDHSKVHSALQRLQPEIVINCAAWTDVDGCESDQERAFAANATGPHNLADSCALLNARFVTISTDYVFDGLKDGFYTEDDPPNPQSVYGISKLEGELHSLEANPETVVVRSGFIFGVGGRNFLSTVVQRARNGEQVRAIRDAFGTPTFANDLAARLRELAMTKASGVFHVTNSGGGVSYEEFARAALTSAGCRGIAVEPVLMESLKRPAPRPRNSSLASVRSEASLLSALPDWRESLANFINSIDG